MPKRRPSSPLDQRQKALEEQDEKLQREMRRLQEMIEDAPRRAAEEEKRRKYEILERSREARRPQPTGTLVDRRYDLNVGPRSKPRRGALKAERREARLKFFGLCILLVALLIFLFTRF